MIKTPIKMKKAMTAELKRLAAHVQTLASKGKASTEEDARIIINDILAYVLGYDKYNDLKTEFKDRNGRLDYIVKLSEGMHAKKKDKYDFVIEAKAINQDIKQDYINQTLTYCLSANVDYFVLTNAKDWQLYRVHKTKNKNEAQMIWEVNLMDGSDLDTLVEDMYVFTKHAYLENKWEEVADHSKATDLPDILAVIYSDKMIKSIARTLRDIHEVKVAEEVLKEVISEKLFKDFNLINKPLLKKLNQVDEKQHVKKDQVVPTAESPAPIEEGPTTIDELEKIA